MDVKRMISSVLVWVMILGILSGCGNNQSAATDTTYSDAELARAVEMGIGHYRESDDTITYAEFLGMLDKVVELSCAGETAEWESIFQQARKSNDDWPPKRRPQAFMSQS